MCAVNFSIRSFVLAVFLSAPFGASCQAPEPQPRKSPQMKYTFPEGSIHCARGDYAIRQTANGSWRVYLVEDLFVITRLVALKGGDAPALVDELSLYDSATPPDWNEIKLLVDEYKATFSSSAEATAAIDSGQLGDSIRGLCRSLKDFPQKTTQVYRKKN
jgi:hypothetical protein